MLLKTSTAKSRASNAPYRVDFARRQRGRRGYRGRVERDGEWTVPSPRRSRTAPRPGLHHLLLDDASRANGCLRVQARIANHVTELPDWRRWAEQTRAVTGGVLPVYAGSAAPAPWNNLPGLGLR